MKKILLIALASLVSVGAYAQGKVAFGTAGASVLPNTITLVNGSLAGPGILAALYWAQDGVTDDSMFMQAGASKTILGSTGLLVPEERRVPEAGFGMFQIRAWESAFGATYEEAKAAGSSFGSSAIFRANAADANNPTLTPTSLVAAANGAGVPMGFQLQVPEPSVIALGLLGAGALLALRRRK